MVYENWDTDMPCTDSDILNQANGCGACGSLNASGAWSSENCDDLHSFVCEYTWRMVHPLGRMLPPRSRA